MFNKWCVSYYESMIYISLRRKFVDLMFDLGASQIRSSGLCLFKIFLGRVCKRRSADPTIDLNWICLYRDLIPLLLVSFLWLAFQSA